MILLKIPEILKLFWVCCAGKPRVLKLYWAILRAECTIPWQYNHLINIKLLEVYLFELIKQKLFQQ